jgi:Skp family chaperone for outer membrane proteins
VRKLLFSAAVFGLVVSCGQSILAQQTAPAQQIAPNAAGANAARYGIAVVDISYIFKKYPHFTNQIDGLKTEMESVDGQLKAEHERIRQMEEERNQLKPGSNEFKQLDETVAQQKAQFSIKQGTVRRDFLEREAKVYYETYLAVSNAVKHYAQQNNIGMVLRFNGDQIDPNQREDVMRAIMQPIVHQNGIDITPEVLALLNRGGAPAGAAPVATRPAARPQ